MTAWLVVALVVLLVALMACDFAGAAILARRPLTTADVRANCRLRAASLLVLLALAVVVVWIMLNSIDWSRP